jgi:hypothetical protein
MPNDIPRPSVKLTDRIKFIKAKNLIIRKDIYMKDKKFF